VTVAELRIVGRLRTTRRGCNFVVFSELAQEVGRTRHLSTAFAGDKTGRIFGGRRSPFLGRWPVATCNGA